MGGEMDDSMPVPPRPQILQLMGAASQIPSLAGKIANGFNHPPDYSPWWFDPAEAGNDQADGGCGRLKGCSAAVRLHIAPEMLCRRRSAFISRRSDYVRTSS